MKQPLSTARAFVLALISIVLVSLAPAGAIVTSDGSPVLDKLFMEPAFEITNWPARISDLPPELQESIADDLAALEISSDLAFYDLRGGRLNSLVLTRPLVPGPGVGNSLSWSDLGLAEPSSDAEYADAVLAAFESFLAANATTLAMDSSEFEAEPNVVVQDGRRLTQIHVNREVGGVPVRFDSVTATVNSGNLILYGVRNWGAVDVSTLPSVTSAAAESIVEGHLAPNFVTGNLKATQLELIPQAKGSDPNSAAPGDGYTYRLAWVVTVGVLDDYGTYEGVVDAHSGELLAVTDLNNYLTRRTVGGILPVSNDGLCQGQDCSLGGKPDGIEQPGHPMPFANLTLADGSTVTTNSGGLADFSGAFSSDLTGPYVRMTDTCGFVNESTVCTDLDFGAGPGTDCAVPAGADSLGNTHSSRTGFYELNRVIELVRSRTPASDATTFAFVNGQIPVVTPVTSNMNLPLTCNAFFTPALPSINFYREGVSSGGTVTCRNTGEIAAVFDHEYGHFLDDFDGNGLSSPSEAYADIVGITRLNDSCVGRGFFKALGDGTMENEVFCTGFGNTCLECSGVREDDFLKKVGMDPSGIDWATGNDPDIPGGCTAPTSVPLPAPGLQSAPCGGSVHCNGTIVGEAIVDLMSRDLICMDAGGWERVPGDNGPVAGGQCAGGAAPTMDVNTALELVTLMFYQAKSNIGFWFVCNPAVGGCTADSGYQQLLAADDDNGNLLDGTPHHEAIFAAFDRHQIACTATAPPVVNASCGAGLLEPERVTGLTATATVNGADLDWDDTPGALEYWVYRTEGVLGCEQGKTRIATLNALVDGSQYSDVGNALDGMEQYYSVMAVGTPSCYGQMSECSAVTPLSPGGNVNELSIGVEQGALSLSGGDGDIYLDNCEAANLSFSVANNGTLSLSNVQVIDIRPVSHPQTSILTPMPISLGNLDSTCGGAGDVITAVDFQPLGMNHDETLILEVDILAAEFSGVPQTAMLFVSKVESDDGIEGNVLYDFESGNQDWNATFGSFDRSDAGLGGAPTGSTGTFYQASSSLADSACDVLQSPVLKLTPTSTLSLFNQFDIEPTLGLNAYDRANVALVDPVTGARTVIVPDGDITTRNYTVPGGDTFGGCLNVGEAGWNGAGPGWLESTWSASSLQAAVGTIPAQGANYIIQVVYGTDASLALGGFEFDQVSATDVFSRGPDEVGPAMCVDVTNLKPDAVDDTAMTDQGISVLIPVLNNDSDPDAGDVITITNVSNGANGTAVDSGGGIVTYTPDPAFVGVDTFTYSICDNGSPVLCDSATVTVTVLRVVNPCVEPGIEIHNDPEGDVGVVVGGTGLPAHDVLSFSLAQDGSPPAGNFIFTLEMASLATLPNNTTWPVVFKDNNGADRWVRMWTDEFGTVAFAYGNGNNPGPFGNLGTPADPSSSFDADGTIRIVVPMSAFPLIEVGDTFNNFITRIRLEAAGSALTPDNMPDDLVASGSFLIVNCDGNTRPVANDDSGFNVTEANTLSEAAPGVLGNDFDADGDDLSAVFNTDVSNGVLVLNSDGSFEYTPDAGFCGASDSFTYFANDGQVNSEFPATVTIDVQCLDENLAPEARNDAFTSPEDTVLMGNVGADNGNGADSDPNPGDSLTYAKTGDPSNGSVMVNSDGTFSYTPNANFHGSDSFTYEVCDDGTPVLCDSATVSITVTAVNDDPVAVDDSYMTEENTTLVVDAPGVLGNDDDIDGESLTAALVSGTTNGSLVLNADGSFSYDPNTNFNGFDSFTYVANDGQADSNLATVTIEVKAGPSFPSAVDDTDTTVQDTPVTIDVLANDSDPDGDPLSVGSVTQPANGSVVNNGSDVTYTPNPGFTGSDGFTYSACDPTGRCDTATVTVAVDPIINPCSGDDDDFDSDGVRDDADSDDDNDGIPDDADSDDDNDCIDDDFDNEGMQEEQSRSSKSAPANSEFSYTISADSLTTLLVALAEGPAAESLVIDILDPGSSLVATSAPTPGQALATAIPVISGDYTVRVKNPTPAPISYTMTSLVRKPW